MIRFLTVEEAADRVGKSPRTIGRWHDAKLIVIRHGLIREDVLLEADKLMRASRGRPRKANPGAAVLAEVAAERARQDAKWGEQNHPDGTGPDSTPLVLDGWNNPTLVGATPFRVSAASRLAEGFRISTDVAACAHRVTWRHILLEEVFETLAESDPVKLRAELIQVAAVATQWAEAIDRRAAAVGGGE